MAMYERSDQKQKQKFIKLFLLNSGRKIEKIIIVSPVDVDSRSSEQ